MSNKDLGELHVRLNKVINANFTKPIVLNTIVKSIDIENGCFTVGNDKTSLVCLCQAEGLGEIKENDNILLKGYPKIDPQNGRIYILSEFIYKTDEAKILNKKFELYSKLKDFLLGGKCASILKKLEKQIIPHNIYNIGVIVFPDNEANIENFKQMCSQKCLGGVYIYRLSREKINNELRTAVEYLKKYRQTDIVCILSNQVNNNDLFDFSSKENVKYLVNRKNTPYIATITSPQQQMKPLNSLISNKIFHDIEQFVDFVYDIQNNFKININHNIEVGVNRLNEMVEFKRKKLFKLEMYINELNDPAFKQQESTQNSSEKVKKQLLNKFNELKLNISSMENYVMQRIIDDSRMKDVCIKLDQRLDLATLKRGSEPFGEEQQKVMGDKINSQEAPNPHIEKIENTTPNNISTDKISINIQRHNGNL